MGQANDSPIAVKFTKSRYAEELEERYLNYAL